MFFEHLTRVNLFSYVNGYAIIPWIRNGMVRAQGVSANSITAGAIGATLLPLFFWLWKSGKAKLWGAIGLAASTVISLASLASTPITGFLAGIMALCLWPIRRHMQEIRWGIVLGVLGLAIVMKAPVWFVITRFNIAGGESWDRAYLIDQTVRHFSDWWLWGTKDNASWGDFTWDQCNQFAAEGLQGGLATLVLFLLLLRRGFGRIGQCRKLVEGDRQEWLFWCLGATLFAHVIVFLGVDYFDQTHTLWFVFLAMISASTSSLLGPKLLTDQQNDEVLVNSQSPSALPSGGRHSSLVFPRKNAQSFKPGTSYSGKLEKE
jgi:MFS family permease